ncbi:MAG: hypothetical protein ACFFC7_06045 [Candidatus Hermodarchaeota archaeon]
MPQSKLLELACMVSSEMVRPPVGKPYEPFSERLKTGDPPSGISPAL